MNFTLWGIIFILVTVFLVSIFFLYIEKNSLRSIILFWAGVFLLAVVEFGVYYLVFTKFSLRAIFLFMLALVLLAVAYYSVLKKEKRPPASKMH
jgi:hypothetical protein